jgi:hypothetical protein
MPYVHDRSDVNINNLHHAMELVDELPHVRVTLGADNITVTGNVNIASEIKINNTELQSIPVHLTDDPIGVTGTFWQTTQPVSIASMPTTPVTGTFWQTTQPVSLTTLPDGQVTLKSSTAVIGKVQQDGDWTVGVTGTFWQTTQPVSIASMPTTPVTGTFWQTTQPVSLTTLPDSSVSIKAGSNLIGKVDVNNWPATQPVSIASMPTTPVTGTFWQTTQPVSGTVTIQDGGGSITVDGSVTATITDVITVLTTEDAGSFYAFNNHAANSHRGWTMDDTMRPVVSFQNGSANTADMIKIVEYEIGNNNANQSTIIYEWYEGPLTISGAAIPAWTTFGVHSQYRVYQDRYSSNQGNTFTVPNGNGTYLRHSGIIIGKNASSDEGPANLHGGSSPNMLTLCMRRVDNATKLDVWFAFTVKELA